MKKTVLSFVLVFTLLLSMIPTTYALSWDATTNSEADALNELGILMGTNSGYQLDQQLKRSEAATFIVRLLGKENEVKQNASKYMNTGLSDTPSTAWYTPYVGYCVQQGIISGFSDNTYRPNNYISEKAMLKLVLEVLGYHYMEDFTWSNVYLKAYEAGIMNDASKINKTDDNTSYYRGDIVHVLYSSVTAIGRDGKTKLIEKLLVGGAVTIDQIKASGIAFNTTPVTINSISVIDAAHIKIVFNQEISELNMSKIFISQKSDTNKALTIQNLTIDGDEVTVTTAAQQESVTYVVKLAEAKDQYKLSTTNITGEFVGYTQPIVTSNKFRISKVIGQERNLLYVYFTTPVVNPEYFSHNFKIYQGSNLVSDGISKQLACGKVSGEPNVVAVRVLNTNLTEGKEYSIHISGSQTDLYGSLLGEGNGENVAFLAGYGSSESLKLLTYQNTDPKTIKLVFNKELSKSAVENTSNYLLKDGNGNQVPIAKAVLSGDGESQYKVILLSLSLPMTVNMTHTLQVRNIIDNMSNSIYPSTTLDVINTFTTIDELDILYAGVESKNIVRVYLDKPLNPLIASNLANYRIESVNDPGMGTVLPERVLYDYDNNPYTLYLYTNNANPMLEQYSYKVIIKNIIVDELLMGISTEKTYTFTGGIDVGGPKPNNVVFCGNNTIRLEMTHFVSNAGLNAVTSNYSLSYTEDSKTKTVNPTSVSIVQYKYIMLKFDKLDESKDYRLKFGTMLDYNNKAYVNSLDYSVY